MGRAERIQEKMKTARDRIKQRLTSWPHSYRSQVGLVIIFFTKWLTRLLIYICFAVIYCFSNLTRCMHVGWGMFIRCILIWKSVLKIPSMYVWWNIYRMAMNGCDKNESTWIVLIFQKYFIEYTACSEK